MPEPLQQLHVDGIYRNTNRWQDPGDVFNRFFRFADGKGIKNVGGFRAKSKASGSTKISSAAFVLLVTNLSEAEWPDRLDSETGLFTYYGDNRRPGRPVNQTPVGGNLLLEDVYSRLHVKGERQTIPPFLAFQSFRGTDGAYMRFLGLACPGAPGVSASEDLVAAWRVFEGKRFQNYRALLTILAEPEVSHAWLQDLVAGAPPAESPRCPPAWREWALNGVYRPLKCEPLRKPRSRQDQEPATKEERAVLDAVLAGLNDRQFEFAARELLLLLDHRFTELQVTRAVVDKGRDILGFYLVGHDRHQVRLEVCAEAKRWEAGSIGVKPMARLLSRLKHRDLGVFLTTSYFHSQVQKELRDDAHPVILISGGDVARLLISKQLSGPGPDGELSGWLRSIRAMAAEAP